MKQSKEGREKKQEVIVHLENRLFTKKMTLINKDRAGRLRCGPPHTGEEEGENEVTPHKHYTTLGLRHLPCSLTVVSELWTLISLEQNRAADRRSVSGSAECTSASKKAQTQRAVPHHIAGFTTFIQDWTDVLQLLSLVTRWRWCHTKNSNQQPAERHPQDTWSTCMSAGSTDCWTDLSLQ